MDRALPLAVRVAAVEAATGLLRGVGAVVVAVDLAEVRTRSSGRLLRGSWRARHVRGTAAGCFDIVMACLSQRLDQRAEFRAPSA